MKHEIATLDTRRNELVARLAHERLQFIDAVHSLGHSLNGANRVRQKLHRATEWFPLGMAVLSASIMLRRRRNAPRGLLAWAVELWGLWRTGKSVIQTLRASRARPL